MKSMNEDAEDEEQCLIFRCLQENELEGDRQILDPTILAYEYRQILDLSMDLRAPYFDKKEIFAQIKSKLH